MTSEYNTIIYDFIPPVDTVDNGYRRYIAVGNSKRRFTVFKAENEYIIAEQEKPKGVSKELYTVHLPKELLQSILDYDEYLSQTDFPLKCRSRLLPEKLIVDLNNKQQ